MLLTETYPKARRELCDLLSSQGFQMVADVMDNLSAVRLVKTCQPDIVILDAGGKFPAGLNAAREILHWNRKARIILLSLHSEDQYMRAAFRSGVRGYVLKARAMAELGQAILEVSKGGIYLSNGMRSSALSKHMLGNE